MYVQSAVLSVNGTLSVSQALKAKTIASGYYPSVSAAIQASQNFDQSYNAPFQRTSRSGMQNGVISFKRYRNTPYQASYKSYRSFGGVVTVDKWNSTNFRVMFNTIAQGFQGFYNNGWDEYTNYLDISGSSLAWQAVYNRAVMNNLVNRAITECRNKASHQKIDLGESLAGIRQTVLMIAENTSTVLKTWHAVRKGDVRGALKHLGIYTHWSKFPKDVANLWLALQYGWLPLLNDISDGIAVVNGLLDHTKQPEQFVVTRRLTTGLILPQAYNSVSWVWNASYTTEALSSVETKFRMRVSDPFAAYLNSLNVLNPAYLAWAALPFSFVVDWLIPVGSWLEALTASIGLQFMSGYTTLRSWGSSGVNVTKRDTGSYAKVYEQGASSCLCEVAYIRRTVYSSLPFPAPYFKFPFSSDRRIASAIALTISTRKYR